MEITYRVPATADAGRIAELHVACWREAYAGIVPVSILDGVDMAERIARWRGHLEGDGGAIFLAEAEGAAAGFIHAGRLAEPLVEGIEGHIFALYVLARHHRRGIGRRLIGLAAAQLLGQGGRALSVGVLTANAPARAFYEVLGARFVRDETYHWHGHDLPESIYLFENLAELARFA